MCAIYRPRLKKAMLKVSQFQLSHAVATPILIVDRARIVLEVGFVAVLYASLSEEVIFSFSSV